ncbi:MAG TPA: cupin domain-containing protein, partial [Mesorhizobium sp.]|nr:cupin domain-containing protein [Mesorhizobium sp.]
ASKAEMFISRSKFPPNYKVPPRTHSVSEVVTVISGSLWHAMGEKFDAEKGELFQVPCSPFRQNTRTMFGRPTKRRLCKFKASGRWVSRT